RALFKVDDGLADPNGLHNLRIIMTPEDTNWLFDAKNLMSNDLVGATVIDDEQEAFYDVGLRLKSSQRGRHEAARVGFALRFPPDQPFRGIHRSIMVDRSEGIGFGQRELLFIQAMNHAGSVTSHYDDLVKVLTPRPEHTGSAHLQLARFGDLLLDFQFESGGDGMLFEYELIYYPTTTDDGTPQGNKLPQPDVVVGTPIQDLGDDKEAYRLPFILKNNRWRDDYRGLIRFAKVFGLTGAELDAKIEEVIDVDQWLRAFAFGTLSGAIDNYAAGSQHNGDFYVRPSDGRVLYFPHDLDFYGGSPQSPVVASGDLAKLIAAPSRSRAYYGHLYDIVSSSYNGAYMASWCDHLGQLLPAQNFAGHLQFITARADWVLNSAPDAVMKAIPKVAFQINTNGGAPLSVATPTVTLDGAGWIDIAEVHRAQPKAPVALTWLSQTAWQATLPVSCGDNLIELVAFDRHGNPVGSDTLSVTRMGAGCP
ncbi:MAG TPA: CotH kinase family protein, partial [Polyangiaceae bacterium]|nr:CotH kinase family protein [Polyangiaceae bacterium]